MALASPMVASSALDGHIPMLGAAPPRMYPRAGAPTELTSEALVTLSETTCAMDDVTWAQAYPCASKFNVDSASVAPSPVTWRLTWVPGTAAP